MRLKFIYEFLNSMNSKSHTELSKYWIPYVMPDKTQVGLKKVGRIVNKTVMIRTEIKCSHVD